MMSKDAKSESPKPELEIGKGTRQVESSLLSGHLEEGIQSQFQGHARYAEAIRGTLTRLGARPHARIVAMLLPRT